MTVPNATTMKTLLLKKSIAEVVMKCTTVEGTLASISKEKSEPDYLRHNTIVWLINVLFSDQFLPCFLCPDDRRSRQDLEDGDGVKMDRFWDDVANEIKINEILGSKVSTRTDFVDRFESDGDERIREHIDEDFNPHMYSNFPASTYKDWTQKLIEICMHVNRNRTKSGEHGNDL